MVGGISTSWENPANWNCGSLPNENVDVIIPSGLLNNPILSSNSVVKSLKLLLGADVKVNSGYNLFVKGVSDRE